MALEMPLDQIKQLQILLRKDANLSWYDPEDHLALPKLPSVAETVAKLDPSPPYLRCKNCSGRLLRGVQSSICVFCGANPHKDLPPEPIKFRNTLGYKWLLESLQLDGSEMVAPVVDENASSRGRSESKDEIPLSELLDLEIRWPSEAERTPSSNSDSAGFQAKSSLNLAGVDLDSFFDRRESESDAFEQNLASGRQVVDTASGSAFQTNESLSLFQNVQASEAATGSKEDQSDDSFSGWEATFKSASSGPVNEESKLFDHSKVDLDAVSGSWKDSAGVKKNDDFNPSASTENDWFQVDGWRTYSNSEVPSQTGKPETSTDLSDTKKAESADGSSSRNFDPMQDDQWPGSDNKTTADVATDEADNSIDAWNDFTGSASTQDPSSIISSSKTGKSEITAVLNDTKTAGGNSSSIKDFGWMQDDQWPGSNNKTIDTMGTKEVADSLDDWNDFTGSANVQYSSSSLSNSEITGQTGKFEFAKEQNNKKIAESASGSSRNFDWMQDDEWQGSNNKASGIVTTNEVADSFDDWNDFTGSSITQNPSSSVSYSEINGQTGKSETSADLHQTKMEVGANTSVRSFDWMQNDQWQINNNKSNAATTTNEVVDSFDVWNGFTSMATMQDSSGTVSIPAVNQTSSEQTSGLNIFSSLKNNSHDVDFSGFSQHDLFLGQFSSPLSSPAATSAQSAAASTNRVADVDATRGNSRDVSTAQVGSKGDDVEMLMSQMHDLSFMLESSLSIPPK